MGPCGLLLHPRPALPEHEQSLGNVRFILPSPFPSPLKLTPREAISRGLAAGGQRDLLLPVLEQNPTRVSSAFSQALGSLHIKLAEEIIQKFAHCEFTFFDWMDAARGSRSSLRLSAPLTPLSIRSPSPCQVLAQANATAHRVRCRGSLHSQLSRGRAIDSRPQNRPRVLQHWARPGPAHSTSQQLLSSLH